MGWWNRLRRYFGGADPAAVPELVERLEGRHEDVSVALVELPVQRRPSGEVALRDADATGAMLDAATDQLPHARRQGKERWSCGSCQADLGGMPGAEQRADLRVGPGKGPPFTLEVTMPGWQCWSCGAVQVASDDERANSFREAIMAAMASGGVKRS
ncbi:hypothetical protein ER308_03650 [Egibacter rhizosphaerae]|uniref:Uncharacterized protein n=1 Tax=Egibacter rhizosphaerae TaxID=1670831 RepID=A0A411YBV1_9ACTN|nr:hypothetical protein [Egibacter rhizosphaerae]QBI18733.1 hypothetical protein ER308_03650 [Egibacter rhizosphaerae]